MKNFAEREREEDKITYGKLKQLRVKLKVL